MRLIYLAGPYSDKDESVRQQRVDKLAEAIAYFMNVAENLFLFSPILHHYKIANNHSLPHDFKFWAQRDFFMIRQASALWVLTISGWDTSFGVAQEIEFAESLGRDIFYVSDSPTDYYVSDVRPDPTTTID
jgi:hypothetical protein